MEIGRFNNVCLSLPVPLSWGRHTCSLVNVLHLLLPIYANKWIHRHTWATHHRDRYQPGVCAHVLCQTTLRPHVWRWSFCLFSQKIGMILFSLRAIGIFGKVGHYLLSLALCVEFGKNETSNFWLLHAVSIDQPLLLFLVSTEWF